MSGRDDERRHSAVVIVPASCPTLQRLASLPTDTRRAGFTLIELLSVVAIVGVLSALAVPKYHDQVEKAKVAKAIGDLRALASDLNGLDSLPPTLASIGRAGLLDPWGNSYIYNPFPSGKKGVPPGARKDRFLVPINSMFDLYSMGKDGQSSAPLTASRSRDDVIMANDGGYYGLARNY